jgi:penicillin-binding protein 1A
VCGVWYGNDDYSPLNRMTGGSLPAQTWHEIMAYAHQGIELKQVAGIGPNGAATGPIIERDGKGDAPIRPAMLTHKGVDTLLRVERLMDEAGRRMAADAPATQSAPPAAAAQPPVPARRIAPGRADNKAGSVAAAQ